MPRGKPNRSTQDTPADEPKADEPKATEPAADEPKADEASGGDSESESDGKTNKDEKKKPKSEPIMSGKKDADAPVTIYSTHKGIRQLVHVEKGKARVGEKENYKHAVLKIFPGLNRLVDDPDNDSDEGNRASIWHMLIKKNRVVQDEVKKGRFQVVEKLEDLPEDRIVKFCLDTGRKEDLEFIRDNDERAQVKSAAQDELDAMKGVTDKVAEEARNKRRLDRMRRL